MRVLVLGAALAASLSGCATMQNFAGSVGEGFSQMKNSMFGSGHLIGAQISQEAYDQLQEGKATKDEIAELATVPAYEDTDSKVVYRTIKQKSFKNTLITYTFSFDNKTLSAKAFEEREATENDLFSVMAVKQQ